MLMKMISVQNLIKKIKKLQSEKSQLHDELKQLKLEVNGKALKLEQEVDSLEETNLFQNLVAAK